MSKVRPPPVDGGALLESLSHAAPRRGPDKQAQTVSAGAVAVAARLSDSLDESGVESEGSVGVAVYHVCISSGESHRESQYERHPRPCQHVAHSYSRRDSRSASVCTKRLLPLLLRSSDPRVVNLGSTAGILGPNVRSGYGVSKAALHALTIATASELQGKVAVNALSPGWVKTDMAPDGPGDPRWSAEGALAIVTGPAGVTGKLFHGKRIRAWASRASA